MNGNNKSSQKQSYDTLRSLVSIDGRGQLVISKEIREIINLKPGDKLAVFTSPTPSPLNKSGLSQKIVMVKVEDLVHEERVQKHLK